MGRKRRRRGGPNPLLCLAFGCGMLFVMFCSLRLFLLIVAVALIVVGCRGYRYY